MNELKLIKTADFGGVQCDFYGRDNEVFMTSEQLGECLGYSHSRESINKLVQRNDYLRNGEFSAEVKMTSARGDTQQTRIFTEDGIYEVTMLSKTEKAKEFRAWVRTLLKSLRTGKAKLVSMTEYQKLMAETRQENIKIRKAGILKSIADQCAIAEYKQVLHSTITEIITGQRLLPLPEAGQKTFSAEEIGNMFGISKQMVGRIANANGLKTEALGKLFYDKARGIDKQVESFRYFEAVIPEFERILGKSLYKKGIE